MIDQKEESPKDVHVASDFLEFVHVIVTHYELYGVEGCAKEKTNTKSKSNQLVFTTLVTARLFNAFEFAPLQ